MNFLKAKSILQDALDHQSTISIPKLKKLMNALNMNLESMESKEVKYLKMKLRNCIDIFGNYRRRLIINDHR